MDVPVTTPFSLESLDKFAGRLFREVDALLVDPGLSDPVLNGLVSAGNLLKPAPGVFWRGRETPLGLSPPRAVDLILFLYGENSGIGLSGANAVNGVGLSTQVPARESFAVPYPQAINLPRVILVDCSRRTCRVEAGLSFVEVTILEALRSCSAWEYDSDSGCHVLVSRIRSRGLVVDNERLRRGAGSEDADALALLQGVLALL
jgi:hypothetical protein